MTVPPELTEDEPLRLRALRQSNLVETPLEDRFERITRLAKHLLKVEIAAVSLVEANRQFFKSIQGLNERETSRDASFCGHTILGDDLMIVPDARVDMRFRENPLVLDAPKIVFYAACPLRSHEGFNIGSLCVISSEPRELSIDEAQCLRDLAAMAEAELRGISPRSTETDLIGRLDVDQRRNLVDPVTRAWNQEGMMTLVQETMINSASSAYGFALAVVDIDGFREINQKHGQSAGDEVLRTSARRMLSSIRETDVVGRLGGDEFMIVLSPCESEVEADHLIQHVMDEISRTIAITDCGPISVTAHVGTQYIAPNPDISLQSLLGNLDRALCKDKQSRGDDPDRGHTRSRAA